MSTQKEDVYKKPNSRNQNSNFIQYFLNIIEKSIIWISFYYYRIDKYKNLRYTS